MTDRPDQRPKTVEHVRNARLSKMVRGLLVLAVLVMVLQLPGVLHPERLPGLVIAFCATLVAVGVYIVALRWMGQGRWALARNAVYSLWVGLPCIFLSLYDPSLPPLLQAVLLMVPTVVLSVLLNVIRAASPWWEARRWVVLGAVLFSGVLFIKVHWMALPGSAGITLWGTTMVLVAAGLWPVHTMFGDLQDALTEMEAQREEAVASREAALIAQATAEAADAAKSRFLANMSHELRTPLNAILGYVELVQEEPPETSIEDVRTDLEHVSRSGSHLLALIGSILDLAQVASGSEEVDLGSVDARRLLEEVVDGLRPLATQKGLEVRTDCSDLPLVCTDRTKLRQILINLLGNAIKYTDEGHIEVASRMDDRGAILEITDTGVGMSAADLARVFDSFERADAEITRRVGGVGLGLALAQEHAKLLGLELTAESTPGQGSRFIARIPAQQLAGRGQPTRERASA